MIVSAEHRLVFVEVPRTGTTAIAAELQEHYGGVRVGRKHATLREAHATDPSLREYTVFAGKRNPLDAEVSLYFKLRNNHRSWYTNPELRVVNGGWVDDALLEKFQFVQEADATFADYFARYGRSVRSLQWRHDQRQAAFLSPFEDLQAGFTTMLEMIGVDQVRPLPEVNSTASRGRDFEQYYTPEIRKRAVAVFGPLMTELSYEFPADWNVSSSPLSRAAYALEGVRNAPATPDPVMSLLRKPLAVFRRAAVSAGTAR